jgi:hypothetical protein
MILDQHRALLGAYMEAYGPIPFYLFPSDEASGMPSNRPA